MTDGTDPVAAARAWLADERDHWFRTTTCRYCKHWRISHGARDEDRDRGSTCDAYDKMSDPCDCREWVEPPRRRPPDAHRHVDALLAELDRLAT